MREGQGQEAFKKLWRETMELRIWGKKTEDREIVKGFMRDIF